MESYININKLTKRFGSKVVVNDVSLSVNKGEVLGFLGPNGAGKTTTMRMATGFLTPTKGSVHICGFDIQEESLEAKKYIGYLPEGAPLYPELSPRLFLKFIAKTRGLTNKEVEVRFDDVVSILDLSSVVDNAIETLSKGFKRRVALAQAIMHDPEVLILDEPTDGLDPIQKYEVRKLIKKMSKDKAIIISTHILEEVEAVCDQVTIISKGSVLISTQPDELLKRDKIHNSVYLKVKTRDIKKVKEDILSLNEVTGVEQEKLDKISTLTIFSKNNIEIIDLISKLAYEKKWDIVSLEAQRGRLEKVFRDIVLY